MILTPEQAQDLHDRTLAAIDARTFFLTAEHRALDRKRLASDLAGLREHQPDEDEARYCGSHLNVNGQAVCKRSDCLDARRYSDGIIDTAALYGVTP